MGRQSLCHVVGMVKRFAQKWTEMSGVRGVVDVVARTSSRHQTGEPQLGQMLGHRARLRLNQSRELPDVALAAQQDPQHLDPGGIGEHPEGVGGARDLSILWKSLVWNLLRLRTCIHTQIVARHQDRGGMSGLSATIAVP